MDAALKWEPLAAKIPLRIGMYESPEFLNYTGQWHLGRDTIVFPIGESSSTLMNQVLSAMFAEVVRLDQWPPERELPLVAVISPEIVEFAPEEVPVQIGYQFTFYCAPFTAQPASWTVYANGLPVKRMTLTDLGSPFTSVVAHRASAASMAVKDAIAVFMVDFRRQAGVRECLEPQGSEAGGDLGGDQ